jgi:hypothetical protein
MERMRRLVQPQFTVDRVCLAPGLGLIAFGAAQDFSARLGLSDMTGGLSMLAGGAFILAGLCRFFIATAGNRRA